MNEVGNMKAKWYRATALTRPVSRHTFKYFHTVMATLHASTRTELYCLLHNATSLTLVSFLLDSFNFSVAW